MSNDPEMGIDSSSEICQQNSEKTFLILVKNMSELPDKSIGKEGTKVRIKHESGFFDNGRIDMSNMMFIIGR